MNTLQSGSPSVLNTLLEKLHPRRFPSMSGLMAAIVGFVLDTQFAKLPIADIVVTADGFVLARANDDVGTIRFVGSYADLVRNWRGLIAVAGLNLQERFAAEALFAAKIGYFGRSSA